MQNPTTCRIVNETERQKILKNEYTPRYNKYLYFQKKQYINENTILGYLGRTDDDDEFHMYKSSNFSYFTDFNEGKIVI